MRIHAPGDRPIDSLVSNLVLPDVEFGANRASPVVAQQDNGSEGGQYHCLTWVYYDIDNCCIW